MAKEKKFRSVFLIVAALIAIAAIYMIYTENITTFGTTGAGSSEPAETTPTTTSTRSTPTAPKVEVRDTLPESFSIHMYSDVTSAGVSRSMKTQMTFNGHEVTSWTRSATWIYPDGTRKYCDEKLNAGTGQFSKTKFEGMDTPESQACYNFLSNIAGDTNRDKLVTGMALGKIAPKNDCELPSICYEFK